MEARKLIDTLVLTEKLKDTMRHCYTKNGRRESVAEHCWMASLMAYFMKDEFPDVDMDKVIRMIMIHDLGECFTGDIPVFEKTKEHEDNEEKLLNDWVSSLPEPYATEMAALYQEMAERKTLEGKIYKAIDSLEAVIQHNEADLSTWTPNEYELNRKYAYDRVTFSNYMMELREMIGRDTDKKLEENL